MKKFVVIGLCIMSLILFFGFPIFASDGEGGKLTPIMGKGVLPPEKMYLALMGYSRSEEPLSPEYVKAFVETLIFVSETEGVNADVAFALMMHETGWLTFGGDVKKEQNNFGGLGATGGGAQGASFPDYETGITAVVQHLKCYATDEAFVLTNVDPRYSESLRLAAPYVQWLGKADNPYSVGWASPGEGYGERILDVIERVNALDASDIDLSKIKSIEEKQEEKAPQDKKSAFLKVLGLALMLSAVKKGVLPLLKNTKGKGYNS